MVGFVVLFGTLVLQWYVASKARREYREALEGELRREREVVTSKPEDRPEPEYDLRQDMQEEIKAALAVKMQDKLRMQKRREELRESVMQTLKDGPVTKETVKSVLDAIAESRMTCDCPKCVSARAAADKNLSPLRKIAELNSDYLTDSRYFGGQLSEDGMIPSVLGKPGVNKMLVTLYQGPFDGKQIWWPDPLKEGPLSKPDEDESEFRESLGIEYKDSDQRQIGGIVCLGSVVNKPEVYEIQPEREEAIDGEFGVYSLVKATYVGTMGSQRVKDLMDRRGFRAGGEEGNGE